MQDLRTRLANDGQGVLCELRRPTIQEVHQPNLPTLRWYVDLSTGVARELSNVELVLMGLRQPHATLHSLVGVRQDFIVQPSGGAKSEVETAMRPAVSDGKIKEYALDRNEYSLRCTGGGENFRIEFPNSSASSPSQTTIELFMHAFIPKDADRIVSFSSRGKASVANTQLRDLNNPGTILSEWKRSEDCLPTVSDEFLFTLSNDKSRVEKRSLRAGEILDTTPFRMPAGNAPLIVHLDPDNDLIIGQYNGVSSNGMFVADFRQGAQIAFVPEVYPLDYTPISKCVLFQALNRSQKTRKVFSIESNTAVALEGVESWNLATLFLCPSAPRAVAVMRDGTIQVHGLPDGKLLSTISSMQNHKDAWIVLSVLSFAIWIVCLMFSGRRLIANESTDIVIALVVTWGSLFALHQRTGISFGIGGLLSSFSIGAAFAIAIVLTEWSQHNSATGANRLVRWTITLALLLCILGIMNYDALMFDMLNFREAILGGLAFVAMCYAAGRVIDVRLKRQHDVNLQVAKNQSQWSITQLLWCTSLVAIVIALLNFSKANNRVDWLWLGECLVIHSSLIAIGTYCCTVWRFGLQRGKPRALIVACAMLTTCFGLVAFLSYRFLYRGFPPIPISGLDYCLGYLVGFFSFFAMLAYRTVPQAPANTVAGFGRNRL
jgi:hypothetical protein